LATGEIFLERKRRLLGEPLPFLAVYDMHQRG